MQTFTAASTTAPDPSKHVKYTQGMVLGADDFTQEFAFHNGRNEWLLRELLGYGTTTGLRVSIDPGNGKPQVRVACGAAVSPRGQMIRVCCDQCADLTAWLAVNQQPVTDRLGAGPPASPPVNLPLWVTLCYRECPTDQVPLPGEPCRSEADATAASRWKSDFTLDLSLSPPAQTEEDVLRRFVAWLRQIPVVDDTSLTSPPEPIVNADILEAVREAARDAFAAVPESPPSFPSDVFVGSPPLFAGSPPIRLAIPAAYACDIWSAMFRLWVTELRPMWQARFLPANACCSPDTTRLPPNNEECLLLAKINLPVQLDGANQWQLATLPTPGVEDRRPFLLHLRLLQEWLLSTGGSTGLFESEAVTHPSAAGGYSVVAAGIVNGDGTAIPNVLVYNDLQAVQTGAGTVQISFATYTPPVAGSPQYIVKVTPVSPPPAGGIITTFDQCVSGGIRLLVTDGAGNGLSAAIIKGLKFMIEVSAFGA